MMPAHTQANYKELFMSMKKKKDLRLQRMSGLPLFKNVQSPLDGDIIPLISHPV